MSWGLRGLDNKTGGLKRGELFILAGRPSMGKQRLRLASQEKRLRTAAYPKQ
jgi:replicative DNA helicase